MALGGTLLSQPGETGNDEYSGGILADPTGFSNSVKAKVGWASVGSRCGLLPVGAGSKREKSEDVCGERTEAPPTEGDRASGRAEFWKEEELVGVFSGDCGDVGPSGPSNRSSRFVLHVCT